MATQRSLRALEAFLASHGVDLEDPAFELELNSYGWRVVSERRTRQAVQLRVECTVECDPSIPRVMTVSSDEGHPDRDIALMRALEIVLDYGFARESATG